MAVRKKKKYLVQLERVVVQVSEIVVEAKNEEEAKEAGYELADEGDPSLTWNENYSEIEATSANELE